MKFTTLLPLRYNDGEPVPQAVFNKLMDDLVLEFLGYSEEGIVKGQWIDPKDAELYRDESLRVSVVCDSGLLWKARETVVKMGRELRQKAMYFEIRDYDGVYILEIPPESNSS